MGKTAYPDSVYRKLYPLNVPLFAVSVLHVLNMPCSVRKTALIWNRRVGIPTVKCTNKDQRSDDLN